jgi:transposase
MTELLDTIKTLGRLLDDIERVRIMNGNRIGALERTYGDSLPHLVVIGESLARVEAEAEKELVRAWRQHPLAPWAAEIQGAGEKLTARLIAEIGDPAERPNPAKLWAYCGMGEPLRNEIPRNATQEELFKRGNPKAKKRAYLLAVQFRRTPSSPYRALYEQARERYAERTHSRLCKRCGPSGHPAQIGSPWSLGHQDAAAIRLVAKAFLLDLWKAARADHGSVDSPRSPVGAGTEVAA